MVEKLNSNSSIIDLLEKQQNDKVKLARLDAETARLGNKLGLLEKFTTVSLPDTPEKVTPKSLSSTFEYKM